MIRRSFMALAGALALAGCGEPDAGDAAGGQPKELVFSILSAENQASMEPLWTPLLKDLSAHLDVPVKPFFATNYTALVEAMRFNQTQMGWFSASPALSAVERADGEVIGRVLDAGGADSYLSVLVVQKGSGLTLDKVLKCDRTLNFGIGDAKSTSGTLAPMYYLFIPKGIDPARCFRAVRSASHQANSFGIANGVLDVATNNTVGLSFFRRQQPELGDRLEVIWQSPPIPESGIVVRKDLDPGLKEKIRQFFVTYGQGDDEIAQRQRKVLEGLEYGGFKPADDSYLDPVREMEAFGRLADARRSRDADRIAAAQAELDKARALAASRPPPTPGT